MQKNKNKSANWTKNGFIKRNLQFRDYNNCLKATQMKIE